MFGLLAGLPTTPDAQPAQPGQGQLSISLIIPERAAVVAPAIELPSDGSPRLCNTHQDDALREIRYQDSDQPLRSCSPGATLAKASSRHRVLVTPL